VVDQGQDTVLAPTTRHASIASKSNFRIKTVRFMPVSSAAPPSSKESDSRAAPSPFPCFDVLIVGAGPAGLTAGYMLSQQKKLSFCILEANPTHVGGISRTEEYKGYLFDIGGHRFFSKSEEVEALWRDILPSDIMERPRQSCIYYKGKFYPYPLRAFQTLRNLGIWESFLCVLSYIKARLHPITPAQSFRDWVTNKFGARLFSIFFKSYTEKVWGISCDTLSADWAAQRIRGLNLSQAILSSFGKGFAFLRRPDKVRAKIIKTLIENFRYPKRGPGMLWSAARDKILAAHYDIEMNMRVESFAWDDKTALWTVSAMQDGVKKTYHTRHIISSAPLRETIPAITPLPACVNRVQQLRYRDFVLVALILDTPSVFQDNWIYIHDPELKAGRIQNFASWSPYMLPEGGKGCLGLEYFCQDGDAFWQRPDDELIAFAKDELVKLKLATADQVKDGCVVRQKKAYPVYEGDYRDILLDLKHELDASYPTFHVVGRNGMHRYNNQDHAMMTAMLTVKNIVAGQRLYDVWAVNEDAEYHEEDAS